MYWIRLFWWMVWRGAFSGAVLGALFGTIIGLFIGTVFGAFYGAILGLITGIIDGIALAVLTRLWFMPPQDTPQFRRAASIVVAVCTLVTSLVILNNLMAGTSALVFIPGIIATIASSLIARRFPSYTVAAYYPNLEPEDAFLLGSNSSR